MKLLQKAGIKSVQNFSKTTNSHKKRVYKNKANFPLLRTTI